MATAVGKVRGEREVARTLQPAPGRTLRSLELFTGAGGLALGSHAAGFRHVALVEWNKDACDTLRANVSEGTLEGIEHWRVLQTDARKLDFAMFGPVDLVVGGAPCQPFSIGGKHRGTSDERNMIGEFIRAVRVLSPGAFVLENVRGLLRPAFREYLSYVLLALAHPSIPPRGEESWTEHRERLRAIEARGRAAEPVVTIAHPVNKAAHNEFRLGVLVAYAAHALTTLGRGQGIHMDNFTPWFQSRAQPPL